VRDTPSAAWCYVHFGAGLQVHPVLVVLLPLLELQTSDDLRCALAHGQGLSHLHGEGGGVRRVSRVSKGSRASKGQ
jgi:hypothetical protein